MLRSSYLWWINPIFISILIGLSGCSAIDSNPVNPVTTTECVDLSDREHGRMLWGIWDIYFDIHSNQAFPVPDRKLLAHFNVTSFLQPPNCLNCIILQVNSYNPSTKIMDLDVTLCNPFQISGYDVRGILYTSQNGHDMLIDDGRTNLFDIPGGELINPFKAFAKSESQRLFAANSQYTENYQIYIPDIPSAKYAVDASWPSNCTEPYEISGFSQETIYDTSDSSGLLQVSIKDWQNDVTQVYLEIPLIFGPLPVNFSHVSGYLWQGTLKNNNAASAGTYNGTITAISQNDGTAHSYKIIEIEIQQSEPATGWAAGWGNGYNDKAFEAESDSEGSIYVAGYYNGEVDFDPGPGTAIHTAIGGSGDWGGDCFLSKFDQEGNFQYVHVFGGGFDDSAYSMAINSNLDLYVCGNFGWDVDFDPGSGTDWQTSVGWTDSFLSKFSKEGIHQWTITWGAGGPDTPFGIALDNQGNAYMAGSTWDSVTNYDMIIRKVSPTGTVIWHKEFPAEYAAEGRAIEVDSAGNSYVIGYFAYIMDFDPGPQTHNESSHGDFDTFIASYTSDGNFRWVTTWGGTQRDDAWGITIEDGYVYGTGRFTKVNGFMVGFINKVNINDGTEVWNKEWGTAGTQDVRGNQIIADGNGAIYVTGFFNGTVDLDPGPGIVSYPTHGGIDCSLSKFSSGGILEWGLGIGGTSTDEGLGIAVDNSGNVYTVGRFNNTVNFSPTGTFNLTSDAADDVFIVKHLSDGTW